MLYTCITGHRTRQLAVHHRDVVVVVGVEGVVVLGVRVGVGGVELV